MESKVGIADYQIMGSPFNVFSRPNWQSLKLNEIKEGKEALSILPKKRTSFMDVPDAEIDF